MYLHFVMECVISLVILVFVVILIVYQHYVAQEIEIWLGREINSAGGQLVTLRQTRKAPRYNRFHRTFEVVLASRTGQEYVTTCKVDWLNSEIYWSVSPNVLLNRQ